MVAVTLSRPPLGTVNPLSLLLPSPNPISCSTIAGLSRECSLPRFHTPFSSIIPFRPLPPSLLIFFSCVRSNAIHRRRAREASLPFSSVSTRLIARSRTTGIELLAVGDPLARLLFFICETRSFPPPSCLVVPTRTEGSALSSSSVINSVNDQIYGGQRRRHRNENRQLNCRVVFPHDMGCMLNEQFIDSYCYTYTFSQTCCRDSLALCPMQFGIYGYVIFQKYIKSY